MRSVTLIVASAALAVVAGVTSYEGIGLGLVLADSAVGLVILVSGVIAAERRPESRVGLLMGLSGLAWFAGSFLIDLRFLHRGPLVHLHLSYPTGRLRWWVARVTVAVAYLAAVVEGAARHDLLTLGLAGLVGAVAVAAFVRTSGTARRAGVPALLAALAFAGVLALGAVNRLAGWRADREVLWAYDIVVAAAVLVLLFDLLRGRWAQAVVTDLVVDLGSRQDTGTLRDELGRALGDPSLVVGYWLADESRYVDDAGQAVDPELTAAGRVVTTVGGDAEPIAVLLHDAAVLDDPELVDAVAAAARLAISNARLQAQTRERLAELTASRRRIVEAGDAQRRQIEEDIRRGAQRHLADAAGRLEEVRQHTEGPASVALVEIESELDATRSELAELAGGIHPRILTDLGLDAALRSLASRSAVRVELDVTATRLPQAVEAAIYFVCSEALTNTVKHAGASRVSVTVSVAAGQAVAAIEDDGIGGADPEQGSGLRGLADRIEAMGGALWIHGDHARGTRVQATIPL